MKSNKFNWTDCLSRCRVQLVAISLLLSFIAPTFDFQVAQAMFLPTVNPGVMGDDEEDDEDDEVRFQTVSRLTISFAEDGTPISRFQSSLFTSFSNLMTREELEDIVLEAFQTWAQHSAINVGLVTDSPAMGPGVPGYDFGTGGFSQGDLRFGDIRVGAVPMADDVFAVAVPNIDFISGTWSGDLLFNSDATFVDPDQFFAVALHEAGHVLGLGHNSIDPTSAMHPTALNTTLNATDIAELKLLYGERIELDPNEEDDDTEAEEIENDYNIQDDIPPLVVFGDIEDSADVDLFRINSNQGYMGTITFRLISAKVSLLRARMTILDEDGQQIAMQEETSPRGTDISVTIGAGSDERFFIKIESLGDLENQFGSYALVTTIDENLPPCDFSSMIDTVIRRNYGDLDQEDLQQIFLDGLDTPIQDDMHTNDSAASATALLPPVNIALHSAYRIQASIADLTDIDFYQLQALDSVMSVRVNAMDEFGLIPGIEAFDSQLAPLTGDIRVNGNGELLVEFDGIVVGADYFISVAADNPAGEFGTGNYDLNVAFSHVPRILDQLGNGRLLSQNPSQTHTLYVARSQLFHFGLEGIDNGARPDATIWMSIYDEDGNIKYRVATRPGEFRTAKSVILLPGSYAIRVNVTLPPVAINNVPGLTTGTQAPLRVSPPNRQPRPYGYQVFGVGISDPTGPEVIDPADDPFAPCDKGSTDFCYPNNHRSPDPFIFVDEGEIDVPGSVPTPDWIDANIWYWEADWLS